MGAAWVRTLRFWGDVFFPPNCVHCRELVSPGDYRHLCSRCAAQLAWVEPPHCTCCGHPFSGEVSGERTCPHCLDLAPAYGEGRTLLLLQGPVRSLVHELKYRRGLYVLEDVEALLRRAPAFLEFVRGGVLVPVPLHPRKQRERGYNQSALLAHCLARAAGGNTRVVSLLRRQLDTKSQTFFDKQTRQENLKNAFALARGASIQSSHHYFLVDDVFTTGSTLNSCARALRRAGCLNLDVVTLGHG